MRVRILVYSVKFISLVNVSRRSLEYFGQLDIGVKLIKTMVFTNYERLLLNYLRYLVKEKITGFQKC